MTVEKERNRNCYSGMVKRTGRHALLSNLYRNADDIGRRAETVEARRNGDPVRNRTPTVEPDRSPSFRSCCWCCCWKLFFSSWSVGGGDGEETKRSLSLWRTLTSSEEDSGGSRGGGWKRRRSWGRVRNMRRVLRRRRWMTGLVVGLRVGLPATAHCEAKSLNLWRLGIVCAFRFRKKENNNE